MESTRPVLVADTHQRECRIAPPVGPSTGRQPLGSRVGTVPQAPSALQSLSVLPDGGLFSMFNGSRNQGAAPAETNGGLFSSLGRARRDAPRDPSTLMRDIGVRASPITSFLSASPWPNGPWDRNPPNSPQAAMSFGELAPLAQAQFQFESGSEPVPAARKRVDLAECKAMHDRDLFHCRMVGLPACYAQANLRYSNCLQGKQIPPLNY